MVLMMVRVAHFSHQRTDDMSANCGGFQALHARG